MRTRETGHMQGCLCEGCIINHRRPAPVYIYKEHELVYRLGDNMFHRSLDATRVLFVDGNYWTQERERRLACGEPTDILMFTTYWLDEAERGTPTCWIETWHPEYPHLGANACDHKQHPTWGYWTTNKSIPEEGV